MLMQAVASISCRYCTAAPLGVGRVAVGHSASLRRDFLASPWSKTGVHPAEKSIANRKIGKHFPCVRDAVPGCFPPKMPPTAAVAGALITDCIRRSTTVALHSLGQSQPPNPLQDRREQPTRNRHLGHLEAHPAGRGGTGGMQYHQAPQDP